MIASYTIIPSRDGQAGLDSELAYPVEEITVAGNLKEMLLGIEMVGNDLIFRNSVVEPTIKSRRMTVAGHCHKRDPLRNVVQRIRENDQRAIEQALFFRPIASSTDSA